MQMEQQKQMEHARERHMQQQMQQKQMEQQKQMQTQQTEQEEKKQGQETPSIQNDDDNDSTTTEESFKEEGIEELEIKEGGLEKINNFDPRSLNIDSKYDEEALEKMSYKDVQQIAKNRGLKAGGKRADIVRAIVSM